MRDPSSPVSSAVAEATPLPEGISCVIKSKCFEKSPTLRAMLTYLWEHRDQPISEYAIATEALGRSSFFDSRIDATVRVQISRLRQRLEKYYAQEGQACSERVVVPLGSHQIRIVPVEQPAKVPASSLAPVEVPHLPQRSSKLLRALAVSCALLLIVTALLAVSLYQARLHRDGKSLVTQDVDRFWRVFFGNSRPTRIILPTPVFLAFSPHPGQSVMFRDTTVNDFESRQRSSGFQAMDKLMGHPKLAQNYTVTSDTFASVKLARYLDKSSLVTTVLSSADAPLEALDGENVIAIGTWGTLRPLKTYLDRMSFTLGPHEQSVEFNKRLPGEPDHIDWVEESLERSVWPGVIAVLPGPGGRTHLLILASRHTSALVSFLTSANGLQQLDKIWKSKGSPDYYEVVVNSEMNGEDLVRFWPVALHPFSLSNTQ